MAVSVTNLPFAPCSHKSHARMHAHAPTSLTEPSVSFNATSIGICIHAWTEVMQRRGGYSC